MSTEAAQRSVPAIGAENTERDLAAFLTAFSEESILTDRDPGAVVDRYYVPDFTMRSDDLLFDRARLVEHIGPVRKNARSFRYEVHEAMRRGDRLAARYTLHAVLRRDRTVTIQVHMFADLAPDGRISRVDQITRIPREEG